MLKSSCVPVQWFGVGVLMLFMFSCLHFVGQCLGVSYGSEFDVVLIELLLL